MLKNIIVAIDRLSGISKNGKIPWNIKEDINFFSDITRKPYKKNAVIMGRKTWESIPNAHRGLVNRINIIVSTSLSNEIVSSQNATGVEAYVSNSLNKALSLAENIGVDNVFICGGSQIYKEALKLDDYNLYLTQIDHDYQCDNLINIGQIEKKKIWEKKFKLQDRKNNQEVFVKFTKYGSYDELEYKYQNKEELQYLSLLEDIINNGDLRKTRNGNVWSVFGKRIEFDLTTGFPLLTTKKVFMRGIVEELLFFLKGDTNSNHLSEKGVKIWQANTNRAFLDSVGLKYEEGDMGPMYGFNWRFIGAAYDGMSKDYTGQGFDQIEYCLNLIKKDPTSRRIIMTSYNPKDAAKGCLYPCHSIVIQFYVEKNNLLSMTCYNRSQDIFCGVPFNIASSGLLLHLFCNAINNDDTYIGQKLAPGRLILDLGDVHLYEEHYSQAVCQILREPFQKPKLTIDSYNSDLKKYIYEDFILENYMSYPPIKANMVA